MFGELRLGDDIDDFCIKCKRITNHAVVSIVNDTAAKVRCRSCYSEHDYRHEQSASHKERAEKSRGSSSSRSRYSGPAGR